MRRAATGVQFRIGVDDDNEEFGEVWEKGTYVHEIFFTYTLKVFGVCVCVCVMDVMHNKITSSGMDLLPMTRRGWGVASELLCSPVTPTCARQSQDWEKTVEEF